MDFGLNFFPVFEPERKSAAEYYRETIALSRLADEAGFEHVQTVEHYGSGYGGYCPDPVTLLTAVAAHTSRIRITTGAVIPAFTHPIKLAGKLAMLDVLSDGRLDAGFGRGFLPDEFDWFGVPMDSSRARFDECLRACVRLWSEHDVTVHGEFHSFGPVTLLPRPVQPGGPPVFVASATSAESCAAAGAAGHHLQLVPSVTSRAQLTEMLAAYREAWARRGDGTAPRIQIKYTCYLDDDGGRAIESARTFERNYLDRMAGAVRRWATHRSDAYPGYETFVSKIEAYDFDAALRDHKFLAGDVGRVREQVATVADWFGPDCTLSLQFSPGYVDLATSSRALALFAEHVADELDVRAPAG